VSRANNEELRRTNEELCRDLQRMGERTVDDQGPLIPIRARPMPFSQSIMDTVIPASFMVPKITFTGVEDSKAHITAFHTQMMISRGTDASWERSQAQRWTGPSVSLMDTSLHLISFQHCSGRSSSSTGSPSNLFRSLLREAILGRALQRFPEPIRGTGGKAAH